MAIKNLTGKRSLVYVILEFNKNKYQFFIHRFTYMKLLRFGHGSDDMSTNKQPNI